MAAMRTAMLDAERPRVPPDPPPEPRARMPSDEAAQGDRVRVGSEEESACKSFDVQHEAENGEDGRNSFATASTTFRATGIFPFDCLKCCPDLVKDFFPKSWHKIMGWTHLIMLVGVMAGLGLLVQQITVIYGVATGTIQLDKPWACLPQAVVTLAFLAPLECYLIKTVSNFDEDLRAKRKEVEAQRQRVIQAYMATLSDMDSLLQESTETNASLAERGFEQKRRDFIRFLERSKRGRGAGQVDEEEAAELFREMKRFCLNWLNIFSECSIDPISHPRVVVSIEELNRCATLDELCTLCLERLQVAEVKFFSQRRHDDARSIDKCRKMLQDLSRKGSALQHAQNLPAREGGRPWMLASKLGKKGMKYWTNMSWLSFGNASGYELQDGDDIDGFPKLISFGCGFLVLLSREHLGLLSSFFLGWVAFALEIWFSPHYSGAFFVCYLELCIIIMLVRFERIDIIQRLGREARRIEKEKDDVRKKHEAMMQFWNQVQQNTDIWLYRTVPRLDLYSEVHGYLEDMPLGQMIQGIASVNHKLEALDCELGALEAWCVGGALDDRSKREFGHRVGAVCQSRGLNEIIKKLDDLAQNSMSLYGGVQRAIPRDVRLSRGSVLKKRA